MYPFSYVGNPFSFSTPVPRVGPVTHSVSAAAPFTKKPRNPWLKAVRTIPALVPLLVKEPPSETRGRSGPTPGTHPGRKSYHITNQKVWKNWFPCHFPFQDGSLSGTLEMRGIRVGAALRSSKSMGLLQLNPPNCTEEGSALTFSKRPILPGRWTIFIFFTRSEGLGRSNLYPWLFNLFWYL